MVGNSHRERYKWPCFRKAPEKGWEQGSLKEMSIITSLSRTESLQREKTNDRSMKTQERRGVLGFQAWSVENGGTVPVGNTGNTNRGEK